MSVLKVGKVQSGISLTPANNMVLDASADDGSFQLKRGDGTVILSVSAAGVVDINGSGAPYGKSNIVGTVAQSGGIPTGAIIENGSNANGEYVKFANGTMFQAGMYTGGITLYATAVAGLYSGDVTINLPASFSTNAGIRVFGFSGNNDGGQGWGGKTSISPSTTQIFCRYWACNSTVNGTACHWACIGRWF